MAAYEFDIVGHFAADDDPDNRSNRAGEFLRARPFIGRAVDRLEEARHYEPSVDLQAAVNVAIATGRPLLLTGDPGTGKTMAAYFIARRLGLGMPIRFQVKSDSRAKDLLYEFDAVARFREGSPRPVSTASGQPELLDETNEPAGGGPVLPPGGNDDPFAGHPLRKYVTPRELWLAFQRKELPAVLLIDEIDKAPRDFPNDLLREIEELSFTISEFDPPENIVKCEPERVPIIIITSNSERRLPEPFLRRCIFHHIEMTDPDIERIVRQRVARLATTHIRGEFLDAALKCVLEIRKLPNLDKRPTVDEFWTWLETFDHDSDEANERRTTVAALAATAATSSASWKALPGIGCLVKTREDRDRLG
jgi:MoxR-like ATPase